MNDLTHNTNTRIALKRFIYGVSCLVLLIGILGIGRLSFAANINETVTAAITFSANESVTAADFTVSANGGSIVSVSCGGSGFSNLGSSGSRCILASLSGGATSGTLATVTVKATAVGTLTVTASGTLSNADGTAAGNGSLQGQSFEITSPATPPTPTPEPITGGPAVTKPPVTVPTSTPLPTVEPTPTPGVDAVIVKSAGEEVEMLDSEIDLGEGDFEIVFPQDALSEEAKLITFKDGILILDFSSKMAKTEHNSEVVLSKGLTVIKSTPLGPITMVFPEGVKITSLDSSAEDLVWNGTIPVLAVLEADAIQQQTDATVHLVVEIGEEAMPPIFFDIPIKIVLPGQADYLPGYQRFGITAGILTVCSQEVQNDFRTLATQDCYYKDGDDLVIYTKHLTKFFSYSDSSIVEPTPVLEGETPQNDQLFVYVLTAILVLLACVIIAVLWRKKSKPTPNNENEAIDPVDTSSTADTP